MSKTAAEMVADANQAIEMVDVETAKSWLANDDVVFLDVRDGAELAKGKIPGAVHISRGVLEFTVDPESALHNPALASGKTILVYCASGGRSALAGKTLLDMGVPRVANMLGGIAAWKQADGEIEL